MKLLYAWPQFASHFELCHRCSSISDENDSPYLLKPFQAVLDMQQTVFAPAVTLLLTPESLHLSHPEKKLRREG